MTSTGTADTLVILILSGMTKNLSRYTAGTPDGAAQIFAALATLFGNLVASSRRLAHTAKGIDSPKRKEEVSSKLERRHKSWRLSVSIGDSGQFQCGRVNDKADNQGDHNRKGLVGTRNVSRLSKPRQLQPANRLAHGNLGAAQRAPKGGMTKPVLETVTETILPFTSGSIQTSRSVVIRKTSQE